MTISNPKTALAKLTTDSMASDSKPTESVSHHARVFKAIVTTATATEVHNRPWGVSHFSKTALFIRNEFWGLMQPA